MKSSTRVAIPDPFQEISADFVHAVAATDRALGAGQIMLVPGGDVAAVTLDLPKGLRGQNREQVARRQLLDQVGLDAETAEMRPFQTRNSGEDWRRVLVAERALVKAWRECAGMSLRAVLPDYLALPTGPDFWTLAATRNGVAARLGPDDGFGASNASALAMLDRALRDAEPTPKALLRLGPAKPQLEALFEARDIPVVADAAGITALGLGVPQVLGHGELRMDLRRDPQIARTQLAKRVLPWRWPLLFGLIAAGLWSVSGMIMIDRINAETSDITAATTALVREHFVKTGPVLDARIQVSQALSKLQADSAAPAMKSDPMELFNRVAGVVAAQGAETRSASFAGNETLDLFLHVADFAAAERLVGALSETGLTVTVRDARVREGTNSVRTELSISPGLERN
ncbi:type II secretion system protein GspL [Phaeobacter sp. J2-8]|uniref:type II secretion system protein GspL n=1 Tax=Phaeobacter sp. J2-8 TaxID=2931394 RepID=UPI001FCFCE88|nr:type II secretion system protein GspL [Phaeobacter sp. J2-8]MCJ7874786.1 type II secretion system protein GspL [Phaeobacter sp. J2-8]